MHFGVRNVNFGITLGLVVFGLSSAPDTSHATTDTSIGTWQAGIYGGQVIESWTADVSGDGIHCGQENHQEDQWTSSAPMLYGIPEIDFGLPYEAYSALIKTDGIWQPASSSGKRTYVSPWHYSMIDSTYSISLSDSGILMSTTLSEETVYGTTQLWQGLVSISETIDLNTGKYNYSYASTHVSPYCIAIYTRTATGNIRVDLEPLFDDVRIAEIKLSQNGTDNPDFNGDRVIDLLADVPATATLKLDSLGLQGSTSVSLDFTTTGVQTEPVNFSGSGPITVSFSFIPKLDPEGKSKNFLQTLRAKLAYLPSDAVPANNEMQLQVKVVNGYTIGFFNGVFTTKSGAAFSRDFIKQALFGDSYKHEPLTVQLFHNQSGIAEERPDATWFEDIVEVFEQRASELDSALDNRLELFWEAISPTPEETEFFSYMIPSLRRAIPTLDNFFSLFKSKVLTSAIAFATAIESHPPSLTDYLEHQSQIQAAVETQQKLLLIAHSQGNLFLNNSFDFAKSLPDLIDVKAVHIAPASIRLNGPYILTDMDLVIKALSLTGSFGAHAPNAFLPLHHITYDFTGHRLIETYLNPSLDAYYLIKDKALSSLSSLSQ